MFHSPCLMHSFALSDIGYVRKHNEDAYISSPEKGYFILADGMGGANAGEVASSICVNELSALLTNLRDHPTLSTSATGGRLVECIRSVNRLVYEKGQSDEELRGMGTTVCVAFVHMSTLLISHVGDSRVYRLREESGQLSLRQLTRDHSLLNDLLEMGEISQDEVKNFPYKHILSRSIGTDPVVEPSLTSCPIVPGDVYLLCSDGLTNYVSDTQITSLFQKRVSSQGPQAETSEDWVRSLIKVAKENGGGDNITAIVVWFAQND